MLNRLCPIAKTLVCAQLSTHVRLKFRSQPWIYGSIRTVLISGLFSGMLGVVGGTSVAMPIAKALSTTEQTPPDTVETSSKRETQKNKTHWLQIPAVQAAPNALLEFSSNLAYPISRTDETQVDPNHKSRSPGALPAFQSKNFQIGISDLSSTTDAPQDVFNQNLGISLPPSQPKLPPLAQGFPETFPPELLDPDEPSGVDETLNEGDPELGNFRIEPITPPRVEPFVFFRSRVNYLTSDNIFFELDPTGDSFINPSVSLLITPRLGSNTFFIGSLNAGLLRYFNSGAASYDELGFSASLFHQLDPNTYGQIGWNNQQLYRSGFADQFYNNHNLNLFLGRSDQLFPDFFLNSRYQVSLGFADPDRFSRLTQILGASLTYDITTEFQTGLDYQLTLADFTRQERYDTYHQILGYLTYRMSANTNIQLYGGFSFGRSSQPTVQFDDTIFGISIDVTLPLF